MTEDYMRVTEILFPFSGLSVVDQNVLKRASERGSQVHLLCDAIIQDMGICDIDEKLVGYIESFKNWMPDKMFAQKPARFYCNKHMITGEIDGLYANETGYTLFDIKTPLKESKTWRLQGSAYSYLAKKAGYNITAIEFVKLSKYGDQPMTYHYEEDFTTFIKCIDLYKYFFKGKIAENFLDYM